MRDLIQPGILDDVPTAGRYLTFHRRPERSPRAALEALAALPVDDTRVIGLGPALVTALGADVDGLRVFPHHVTAGIEVPSTPAALLVWLRGDDLGALVHATRALTAILDEAFAMDPPVDAFKHREGRDLSGYVDGTENPTDDDAVDAVAIAGRGRGHDGGTFLTVQRWVHDLAHFMAMDPAARDLVFGRTAKDDVELEDAPPSAHVKRTAQEDFSPPAFVVRRSMPWARDDESGLVFVAFARTLDAYEAQLRRMVGLDDGVTDALFRFSRPVTGAHFFCPPRTRPGGGLDLSALGLG